MLGLVTTMNGKAPVELREMPTAAAAQRSTVEVHAFSLNRGELRSFRNNGEGWVPGQDIAGVVLSRRRMAAVRLRLPGRRADRRVRLGAAGGRAGHRMAVLPDNVSFAQAATCRLPA